MTKLLYTLTSLTAASLFHLAVSHNTQQTNLLRTSKQQHEAPVFEDRQPQQPNVIEPPISSYTQQAQDDQVTDLPGLDFEPNFKHFSGYIPVSPTRKIHYWYIESSNNPSTDPVVFWYVLQSSIFNICRCNHSLIIIYVPL